MNIALVFSGCNRRGGVERCVWEIGRHLSARHSVSVYAIDIESEGLTGVNEYRLEVGGPGAFQTWFFARSARSALADKDYDHVVSFGVGDVGADVLWVNSVHREWLRQSLQYPARSGVSRFPVLRYANPRHQVLLAMEWSYFTRGHPASVVVVADAVGEDLHRIYGTSPAILATIHNGFSPSEFCPDFRETWRSSIRGEFGYAESDVVALIGANELPRKGFDVLVEALALLGDERLHVLLAGRAPLTPSYKSRLQELGVLDRVRYAGSRADMGHLHAAADFFVLPTKYEAFCLAIIEALASGLPVITTKVAGAGDRIIDGVNGRLLDDPTSSTELRGLLAEAMDIEVRSRWAEGAPGSVKDLAWSSIGDQAERLLESLPARGR